MPTSRVRPDYFVRCLAAALFLFVASLAQAQTTTVPAGASNAVVSVTLNSEPKGEFVVWVTPDGKYLAKMADLIVIGIKAPKGDTVDIDGEKYLALQSLQQATVKLDEKTQSFDIQSSPAALGKQIINLLPKQHTNAVVPKDNSVFFNYRTGFSSGGEGLKTFSFIHELGMWRGDYLFLTDGTYTATKQDKQFVRNMSSMVYDKRELFQRVIVGDFFTGTGEFGSVLNLGGVNVSKLYTLQPNYVKHPMASFTGSATLPSEVDIYLNGNKIRSEKIPPGEFELQNLNYFGGARDVQAVVKDKLGREQVIDYKYYFTDDLLQKDLHEYNYGLGMARKDFGVKSFAYENVGFSAFHRYGYSDDLTFGGRGEFLAKKFNAGPFASYRIKQAGIVSAGFALSRATDENDVAKTGTALSLKYAYQTGNFIGGAAVRRYSRGYSPAEGFQTADRPQLVTELSAGYGTADLGNVGIAFNGFKKYVGESKSFTTLSYSRAISGKANLFANYSTGSERNSGSEIFIGFAYYPTLDYSASAFHQKRSEAGGFNVLEGGKNVPAGEGLGYRVAIEKGTALSAVAPSMQYNTRAGFATAELRTQTLNGIKTNSYQLAFSGAALGVDDQYGFSRPVNDSFGFVQVSDLPNVRVYQNNQEIGKTNEKGNLFMPYIGSFVENQISINDKDIPIDYSIVELNKFIAPNYRSGNMIKFAATRIQATTGHLKMRFNDQTEAAEYVEMHLVSGGKTTTLSTGRRGEFYAENLAAGKYQAAFSFKNHACEFELTIPTSTEMLIDLKDVTCEAAR
jgi:outer membrane usher protein